MEPKAFGALLRAISSYGGAPETLAALELSSLAFVRLGELRSAEWSELDLDGTVWSIPAEKMKMRRPRERVKITKDCCATAILREGRDIDGELWAASGRTPKITRFDRPPAIRELAEKRGGPAAYRYNDLQVRWIAKADCERPVPTLDQIRRVIASMPTNSDVEKRDRALIAFAIFTGARDDAIASILIRHVDPDRRTVFHDARDVRSKNGKTFTSTFFPVGEDIESIVTDWISFLKEEQLFGPDDPLFPATKVSVGTDGLFAADGLDEIDWRNATAIRRIFRQAFEGGELPYFNPHSFRKTLGALGEKLCRTPVEFKAWSPNLTHENVLTTFTS